ncbi:MAG: ABC transporter ATP-binding protein [Eubacterium sp.]|nr:ABC transporter ATP-binding protein [Eubacterium sp.]
MLKMERVEKNYSDFRLNVSMEVKKGCITGLVGKNGAGKSTTFKIILGLVRAEKGTVTVMGEMQKELSADKKQELGVILSDAGFSEYLTIKDINAILTHCYKKHDGTYFLQQCERRGLPLDKKVKEFSTGMKAKLKILIALSHGAKLLILDEPTLGLDVAMREELLDLLRDYMQEDEERSILISSHIATDLENLCDEIYMIDNGSIVLHEETDQLLSSYAVLKVDEKTYEQLDTRYVLKSKKEAYGYSCLTNQKQFYVENYPKLVIEQGGIDDLILFMIGGK